MENLDYFDKLAQLKSAYDDGRKKLAAIFAYSNNPYKEGDKVSDKNGSIKITSIGVGFDKTDTLPKCIYKGNILDSEGNTTDQVREIFQPDLVEENLES